VFPIWPRNLNFSNRPVRTRMPGGVAGVPGVMIRGPYADHSVGQTRETATIGYFQSLSREMSLPYQTLMNMYLRDCAESRMRPHWAGASTMKRANKPLKRRSGRRDIGVESKHQLGGRLAAYRQGVRRTDTVG
jgi:hypothetical protein